MHIPRPNNYIPLISRNEAQQTHQVLYEYQVGFEISGFDFDPRLITNQTHLKPNVSQKIDDDHKVGDRIVRKYTLNRWSYQLDLMADTDIEDSIVELCNQLRPHKKYLMEILRSATCSFYISGYSYNPSGQTGIHLSKVSLNQMNEYNPESIDADIYYRKSLRGLIPYWFDRLYDRINTRYIKVNLPKENRQK